MRRVYESFFRSSCSMASLQEAFIEREKTSRLSDVEAYNTGVSIELLRHGRSLPETHPDRYRFLAEASRVKLLAFRYNPDSHGSLLKDLTEPYEIPHEDINKRRQGHQDHEAKF